MGVGTSLRLCLFASFELRLARFLPASYFAFSTASSWRIRFLSSDASSIKSVVSAASWGSASNVDSRRAIRRARMMVVLEKRQVPVL